MLREKDETVAEEDVNSNKRIIYKVTDGIPSPQTQRKYAIISSVLSNILKE